MDTAKASSHYRFLKFQVDIIPFSDRKFAITVMDPEEKYQFSDSCIALTQIGTATLIKALENKIPEIKMSMKVIDEGKFLEVQVIMDETFLVKKTREVNEEELMNKSIQDLTQQIKQFKEKGGAQANRIILGSVVEHQKLYANTNTFESLGKISLKRGQYLITISFFLKAQAQWIYLYLNTVQLIQNGGFYTQTNDYTPYTIKKVFSVNSDKEDVNINTYYAASYPVRIKNLIITAQSL